MAYSQELIVPDAVKIEISGRNVKVEGPKGSLEKRFSFRENIKIAKSENKVKITTESDRKKIKAMVGTIRAHIENLVTGVTEGFTYKLRAVYSHFPITIKIEGKQIVVQNFLGARTPRVAKIIEGVDVKIDKTDLTVTGIDLEKVSQTAANIEQSCRIVGFDKKRFMDGVYITSKGEE
jgi:large subunit ribosomal protein L6